MIVTTVLDDINNTGFKNYLNLSCQFHNIDLKVIIAEPGHETYRMKDVLLNEYLREVSDEEIIFFTDAYDATFLTGTDEIIEKFKLMNCELLFSVEVNCYPDASLKEKYPFSSAKFKYLNSGGFIGRAGFIKSIFYRYPFFSSTLDKKYEFSNQYYWHLVYLENQKSIKLDLDCEIFFTTSTDLNDLNKVNFTNNREISSLCAIEKERLRSELSFAIDRLQLTNTYVTPCHIHFVGPISKILMRDGFFSPILTWLHY